MVIIDDSGSTPLMLTIAAGKEHPLHQGHINCVKQLINAGANVNFQNQNQQNQATVLLLAVLIGHEDIMKMLISAGADVNMKCFLQSTALMNLAVSEETVNQKSVMKILIKAGADLNQTNEKHQTAVMLSAMSGKSDMMKILIEAGADINIYDTEGSSALVNAVLYECVKILIDAGAKVEVPGEQNSPINVAAVLGDIGCLKELLAAHGNKQDFETTPQNTGAVGDADSMAKMIIKPLLSAAKTGKAESVEELLKSGVDVNATDEFRNTALMTSVKIGSTPIFQLLVNHGAEINVENHKGETALYWPVTQSHAEYQRLQSKEGQYQRKHISNVELSLEGSSLMVYILLTKGAHLHDTKSGLNPCTVHLTSAEFKNPNPMVLKLLDAGGAKKNIKDLSSINFLQSYAKDCIREHLKKVYPERSLYFMVPQLGLPERLQSSLLFDAAQNHHLVPNSEENKFLHEIKEGNIENVQHLINARVDVNVQDENDMTPLMIASQACHVKLIEQLIKSGTDVNHQNSSGETALIYAINDWLTESQIIYSQVCVQVLLQHHAEINIQGKDGNTALMYLAHMASQFQIKNLISDKTSAALEKYMCTIINAGADPNLKNDNGCTALRFGANCLNFVKKMIKSGADVNWKDKDGHTALTEATELGNVDSMETLIGAGAEINSGRTPPLMTAAFKGHVESVKLLIREGADLDFQDENGSTALMTAVIKGHVGCAKLLIQVGADLNIRAKHGLTALMLTLHKGDVECLKMFLRERADLDIQNEIGLTALVTAVIKGHVECVKLLIRERDDLDIPCQIGFTVLMAAAFVGHVECVKILIQARADLNIQGKDGFTALMFAAGRGHVECVKLLIQVGADLDVRNENGLTAAILAARFGADSCFSALLKAGVGLDSSITMLHGKQTKLKDTHGKFKSFRMFC